MRATRPYTSGRSSDSTSESIRRLPRSVPSKSSRSAMISRYCSTAASRADFRASVSQGLVRKRKMLPSLTAAMAAVSSAKPVSMTRTVSGFSSRTLARTMMPSMPGIRRSDTTTA